ncbi:hypothetical protein GOP47_0016295 [Adiantum capillus-veneris]|uniref:Rubredoxin-like domain-containing protein n=1 Tax=Adiantum capillus-veneris TaxID=13818 RepID=A0A9D4UHK5_ADICA|nr:hypothetical protein GOP47_0016295 [Adiantum capillus-veneris]
MAAMAMHSPSLLHSSPAVAAPSATSASRASGPSTLHFAPSLGGLLSRRGGVRMEAQQPTSPTKPPGLGGTEIPLGVLTSSAPLEQKNVPKNERIAYICQDCGYVYDLDTPFEDQPDETYNCPVCKAPKTRFAMQNTTVGEALSVQEDDNQN